MAVVRAADLMAASVAILTTAVAGVYPTDAGARIWAPRDWPSSGYQYPAIFVSVPRENKQACVDRGLPAEFIAMASLQLSLRVAEPAQANDAAAGVAQHELDVLQAQIESGLVNHVNLWNLELLRFASIETESAFDSTGARLLGQRIMTIDLEYHCEPESFWQAPAAPLTMVTNTIIEPDGTLAPSIDIDLS